jgi:hypothetical protein
MLVSLAPVMMPAQKQRDDWQHLQQRTSLIRNLPFSLVDVPITEEERSQIYAEIDNSSQGAFTEEEARAAILGTRAGLVKLTNRGQQQILVQGRGLVFCSPTGNCPVWLFTRKGGKIQLVLNDEAQGVFARRKAHAGFTDVVLSFHDSASQTRFIIYRWDGKMYQPVDCYLATSDPEQPKKAAAIRDCGSPLP